MIAELKLFFSTLSQKLKANKNKSKLEKNISEELKLIDDIIQNHSVQGPKKGTLIVKCDDIGDFLVWQNVIPILEETCERPILFVGNAVVKPLVDDYFDFADECLWINKSQWHDHCYRKEIYKKAVQFNASIALEPMFSRNFVLDDMVLKASNAIQRIAWDVSMDFQFNDFKGLNGIATQTIISSIPIQHEIQRNFEFVSTVFQLEEEPKFKPKFKNFNKKKTLILVPVGSVKSKNWDKDNFVKLLNAIEKYFDQILLIGANNSLETSFYIEQAFANSKLMNLTAQTSLCEMFALIGEAQLLISPDTFAIHVAAMTETNAIVLSNGMNWQRFINYQSFIQSKMAMIFPKHFKPKFNHLKKYYSSSEIQSIPVETVVKKVKEILQIQ
jgi:ADP-heptose:LPS heptosyltransferase